MAARHLFSVFDVTRQGVSSVPSSTHLSNSYAIPHPLELTAVFFETPLSLGIVNLKPLRPGRASAPLHL